MKPADLARELFYPLTHFAVLVPMIVSWLLFSIAAAVGLFGILLFLATIFPFLRYCMSLLEARAASRAAPPFDAEDMAFVGNSWKLFPFVTCTAYGLLIFAAAQSVSAKLVLPMATLFCLVYPATLGVLAITQSPLQSLNPLALYRFVRHSRADYLWLVALPGAVAWLLVELREQGLPWILLQLGEVYLILMTYSLTGAVSARHEMVKEVDIPEPLPISTVQRKEQLLSQRTSAANHAYGFASRGNIDAGLRHIDASIAEDPDPDDAWGWYFNQMLGWDNKDAALFFAQDYLHRLLLLQQDTRVLKLLMQCLHINPRFRPAQSDRAAALQLAERHGRTDLIRQLRG